MKEKININFFDIVIFTISLIFFLLIYTEEKSQTYSRAVIIFPKTPTVYIEAPSKNSVEFNLAHPDKFYLPTFVKNLQTLEDDSRIAKLNSFCEDNQVKLYNWDKNVGYLTFTMETNQSGENIDSCFLKLKKYYEKEWDLHKEKHILFLNDGIHSLSKFSYLWSKNSEKHFKLDDAVHNKNGCEKYYELPNQLMHLKKLYYDFCGNYVDLILLEKDTKVEIPIDKEIYLKISNDFEEKGFRNYSFNDVISLNIYQKQYPDLENLFDKKNINNEFKKIFNLINTREYLEHLLPLSTNKNYYFDLKISRNNFDFKNLLSFEKNLSKNIYNFYNSAYKDIMDNTEDYIYKLFLNTNKKIFISDVYKNSTLDIKKSPNYELSTSKSFYSLHKIMFSLISAIFVVLLLKLLFNYIRMY